VKGDILYTGENLGEESAHTPINPELGHTPISKMEWLRSLPSTQFLGSSSVCVCVGWGGVGWGGVGGGGARLEKMIYSVLQRRNYSEGRIVATLAM